MAVFGLGIKQCKCIFHTNSISQPAILASSNILEDHSEPDASPPGLCRGLSEELLALVPAEQQRNALCQDGKHSITASQAPSAASFVAASPLFGEVGVELLTGSDRPNIVAAPGTVETRQL